MKWSSRVKLTENSLVIRLLAVLAAVGIRRVCVWSRCGRRMMSMMLIVVVFVGSFLLAPVSVVRASTFSGFTSTDVIDNASRINMGMPLWDGSPGGNWGSDGTFTGLTHSLTRDGANIVSHAWFDFHYSVVGQADRWMLRIFDNYGVGTHTYVWSVSGTWSGIVNSWSGTVTGNLASGLYPLSVSITGPAAVSSVDGGTWAAGGAGGTGPYTYAWTYGAIGPFFSWPHSGSTFTRVLPVGTWTIECRVTDSLGVTAIADQVVTSSLIVGAYTVHLVRSGVYGESMSANVHNADGTYIGISDVSGTQLGIYADLDPPNELSYGYYDNVGVYGTSNGAADGSTGLWRWTLAFTVGEATVPPPADFWFKASLTLTDDTVLVVIHHFGGISDIADSWYEPGGNDVAPEVPPVTGSKLPAWLQAFLDAVYLLFSPIILVAEIFKMLFNWIVGLLGYIGGAISIVASFGLLMVRWLTVVVASVFNFATAAPGSYVSIQGIMTLAGAGAIAGDTSVFKTVGFSVASMNTVLGSLHRWVMAASHQWIWWAAFSYAFLAFVLQLGGGSSGGEE